MKRIFYTLLFAFFLHSAFAQDDQPGSKVKERMVEYIQNKLGLNKSEAERFQPMFFDYIRNLRDAKKQSNGDRLILQQKVVDLRLRFREQVKPVIGEKRSNDVFTYEKEFLKGVSEQREQLQERNEGRANKRNKPEL